MFDFVREQLQTAVEGLPERDEHREAAPTVGNPAEAELVRLRELVDGIDAVVWQADPDGRVRFVNRRAEELFGYPVERWRTQPWFWYEIAHPEDRAEARTHYLRCVASGQDRELEYRLLAAEGQVVWVRESLRVVCDGGGRVESLRGVMWKINRRKKVERQLYVARRELADQLADLTHLHELSHRLWATLDLGPLLDEILGATTAIQGAEMGMVRLYDPVRHDLEVVASIGLPAEFLERYGRVPVGDVACSLAIERGSPVIIEDVESDPTASPYREPARMGGYRSKFTTVLRSRSGELLGTIATCFREPHRPPEREVRLVELFARQAADFVENARLYQALRAADGEKDNALATLAHELRNSLTVRS